MPDGEWLLEETWICKYYIQFTVTFTHNVTLLFSLLRVISSEFMSSIGRSMPGPSNHTFRLAIATLLEL